MQLHQMQTKESLAKFLTNELIKVFKGGEILCFGVF